MKKAFTIIELLVAITIISIIIGVGIISYQRIVLSARDSRRFEDIKKLQQSLEVFRSRNGRYPFLTGDNFGWATANNTVDLAPQFIDTVPVDPLTANDCPGYLYSVAPNFQFYTIFVVLENTTSREVTEAKPVPRMAPTGNNNSNITFEVTDAPTGSTCDGSIYNYWVNSP